MGTCGGAPSSFLCVAAPRRRPRPPRLSTATPVHFGAGLWGLIAPGLFARPAHVRQVYKRNKGGLFYDGDGRILAVNLIAALATTAWVVCTMGPFFYLLYKTNSLRVSMDKEIDGLDEDKHGGAAYAFDRSQHSKEAGDNQSVPETKEEDVSSLRTGSPIQRGTSRDMVRGTDGGRRNTETRTARSARSAPSTPRRRPRTPSTRRSVARASKASARRTRSSTGNWCPASARRRQTASGRATSATAARHD